MSSTTYPTPITRACSLIDECAEFRSLPDGYIRILFRLIKKIDISNPAKPISATRATLAEETGKSVESIQRCLKWLEDFAFIRRIQRANDGLRGSHSPIIPTPLLLKLLGFNDTKFVKRPAFKSDRSTSSSTTYQSNERHSSQVRPGVTKIGNHSVPADLAWLITDKNLKPSALFMLMSAARKANKILSDVVRFAKNYLTPLSDRSVVAYLLKLISTDKDYRTINAASDAATSNALQKERQALEVATKARDLASRSFTNSSGTARYEVDPSGNGFIKVIREGRSAYMRMDISFIEAIRERKLIATL